MATINSMLHLSMTWRLLHLQTLTTHYNHINITANSLCMDSFSLLIITPISAAIRRSYTISLTIFSKSRLQLTHQYCAEDFIECSWLEVFKKAAVLLPWMHKISPLLLPTHKKCQKDLSSLVDKRNWKPSGSEMSFLFFPWESLDNPFSLLDSGVSSFCICFRNFPLVGLVWYADTLCSICNYCVFMKAFLSVQCRHSLSSTADPQTTRKLDRAVT